MAAAIREQDPQLEHDAGGRRAAVPDPMSLAIALTFVLSRAGSPRGIGALRF